MQFYPLKIACDPRSFFVDSGLGLSNRMCKVCEEDLLADAGPVAPAAVSVLALAQSDKVYNHLWDERVTRCQKTGKL